MDALTAMAVQMLFKRVNNVVHHCLAGGKPDAPALVFVNSLGSDSRIWYGVARQLEGSFKTVLYDNRGHGLSDDPPAPYSITDLALDLSCLLDALDIDQAVICGISVGGLIAQEMALAYSARVRALVLCDTGARIGSVESWEQRIDTVRTGGLETMEAPTMERWFSAGFRARRPEDIRGYAKMLRQTSIEGYVGTCCALRDADFREALVRIDCPTLVLCGAEDVATPPELGRELASGIRGAQFSLIDHAAHLPCIEEPKVMAERMRQFFQEVQIV